MFRKALIHGNLALALDTARELPYVRRSRTLCGSSC